MKKYLAGGTLLLPTLLSLSGCAFQRSGTDAPAFYLIAALVSLVLLIVCAVLLRHSEPWMLVLFACIAVVNCGYLGLALSETVTEALWANRIAYLGSVFLLPSMLMILLQVTGTKLKKWLTPVLMIISLSVFFVAASPGISDIYYRSVTLELVNGAAVLRKVYGPWHRLYTVYLLVYFAALVILVLRAAIRKQTRSGGQAVILIFAVFVNMGVWLMEQCLDLELELLAVSYVISELLLLGALLMQREHDAAIARMVHALEEMPPHTSDIREEEPPCEEELLPEEELPQEEKTAEPAAPVPKIPKTPTPARCATYRADLLMLTSTERAVHDLYAEGRNSRQIQLLLDISENTLKYHNRNIYSKLQVTSRKQLMEIIRADRKLNDGDLPEWQSPSHTDPAP